MTQFLSLVCHRMFMATSGFCTFETSGDVVAIDGNPPWLHRLGDFPE